MEAELIAWDSYARELELVALAHELLQPKPRARPRRRRVRALQLPRVRVPREELRLHPASAPAARVWPGSELSQAHTHVWVVRDMRFFVVFWV